MAELHVIAPTITPEIEKLRVGAYVRVSTDSEDQENSFLTQYVLYSNLIQSKEEWEFVDMYADEGITGTDMKKRDDFNRMVEDCQDGRIDLILTKSISRFARNTYDCISTVRELKRYGANVFFEKEGIDTRNMSSEVELTMMSSFAQEESISISKNITVGFTHKMMDGTFIYSKVGYGFRKEGTQIVIDEYEAKNIRWIFEMCIQGKTIYEITDALIKAGVRKTDGTTDWKVSAIKFIIKNRMYMGDALTRKTYSEGFPFKRKNNIGQRDQYYIRNYCPAIISRETYEQANKIMKLRKIGSAEYRYEGIFKRMVFCNVCGDPMKRTVYNNGWRCHDHAGRGKNLITDDMIQKGFIVCYNRLYHNRENILTPVINLSCEYKEWQNRTNYKLEEIKNRIAQITEQVLIIKKLEAQGCMEPAISMQKSSELNKEISQLKQDKKFLTGKNECDKLIRQTTTLLRILETAGPIAEFDEGIFKAMVAKIWNNSDVEVTYELINGVKLKINKEEV